MATKSVKREVKTADLNVNEIKEVIKQGKEATIESKLAAYIAMDSIINSFKALAANLKEEIEHTKYKDVVKDLVARGYLAGEWETPVFNIGGKYSVRISEVDKSIFTIDTKKLEDIAKIIPDKYKKVTTSFDKGALEDAYDAGTLEPVLKPLVDKKVEKVTKLTKTSIKSAK